MSPEADLSSILNSAIRQHSQVGDRSASLIPFVGKEVLSRRNISGVALWHIDPTADVQLLWEQDATAWATTTATSNLLAIKPGSISLARSANLTGETQRTFAFAASLIDESSRIVAGFEYPEGTIDELEISDLADLFADIRRREMLESLSEQVKRNTGFISLVSSLHEIDDRNELFHRFATDAAVVAGVDRISILSRSRTDGWILECCTGVDSVAERSDEVRKICAAVASAEKSESETVFPLTSSQQWKAAEHACVFENFSENASANTPLLKLLAEQLSMAIELMPARQSRRSVRSKRRRRKISLFATLVIFALLVPGLFIVQTDFQIRVPGETLPTRRQNIFAPNRGVISEVLVEHGEEVSADTVLCRIYNDELEVLREKTREELSSSQARFDALKTIPFRQNAPSSPSTLPPSVEMAELEKKIESLETQMKIIESQIEQLAIVAPFDGQVLHERLKDELLGRPVQQGQYLLQIVDPDEHWEVTLRIPERELRHVLRSQEDNPTGAPVEFVMETAPTVEHTTSLAEIAKTTDLDATGGLSTLATAPLNRVEEIDNLRLGAGVLAKIQCGQRSWFFVLTRGIREFWARHSPF